MKDTISPKFANKLNELENRVASGDLLASDMYTGTTQKINESGTPHYYTRYIRTYMDLEENIVFEAERFFDEGTEYEVFDTKDSPKPAHPREAHGRFRHLNKDNTNKES